MPEIEIYSPKSSAIRAKFGACGEAVDHAGKGPLPHFVGQNFRGVLLGIAGVDDQRQAGFARRCDMFAKRSALLFAVAMVVIIVEPGFANSYNARMRGLGDQFCSVDADMRVGFVRMDANRCPDIGFLIGKCDNRRPIRFRGLIC